MTKLVIVPPCGDQPDGDHANGGHPGADGLPAHWTARQCQRALAARHAVAALRDALGGRSDAASVRLLADHLSLDDREVGWLLQLDEIWLGKWAAIEAHIRALANLMTHGVSDEVAGLLRAAVYGGALFELASEISNTERADLIHG